MTIRRIADNSRCLRNTPALSKNETASVFADSSAWATSRQRCCICTAESFIFFPTGAPLERQHLLHYRRMEYDIQDRQREQPISPCRVGSLRSCGTWLVPWDTRLTLDALASTRISASLVDGLIYTEPNNRAFILSVHDRISAEVQHGAGSDRNRRCVLGEQ
jgi:hypothetical protein